MSHSELFHRCPRVGAIVQVRFGSTRLPGKALLPLPLGGDVPILGQVLARTRHASALDMIIVATTTAPADDAVANYAATVGATVFRGDEQDVLGRFQAAAAAHELDVIVRLTADNPALDAAYLDQAVQQHLATGADYTLTTGLPLGTNVEVISRAALDRARVAARSADEREHVTPFIRNHPELFRLEALALAVENLPATTRLTLDYPSDYALLHLLYTLLPPQFGLGEVAQVFCTYPWLTNVNAGNEQIRPQ